MNNTGKITEQINIPTELHDRIQSHYEYWCNDAKKHGNDVESWNDFMVTLIRYGFSDVTRQELEPGAAEMLGR